MLACTQPTYGGCLAHDYGYIGALMIFIAGVFSFFGFISLLTYRGSAVPRSREKRFIEIDPFLAARAEGQARRLFVALIGLGLAVIEAIPIYNIATTMDFDPIGLAIAIALFAVGDLCVLLLIYLWTGVD